MIEDSGFVIVRGSHNIVQQISGASLRHPRDADAIFNVTVFEDVSAAERVLAAIKKAHPGREFRIQHAAFTCTLFEP